MVKRIDLATLKLFLDTLDEETIVLDVRSDEEVALSKIEGTKHIPWQQLAERISEIKDYPTIITHCAHGMRAKKAADILAPLVKGEILYVEGDIEDWEDAGLPLES